MVLLFRDFRHWPPKCVVKTFSRVKFYEKIYVDRDKRATHPNIVNPFPPLSMLYYDEFVLCFGEEEGATLKKGERVWGLKGERGWGLKIDELRRHIFFC